MTDHRCHRGERCAEAERVETTVCGAECPCHLGPHYRCQDGGCGHTHRTETVRIGGQIMAALGLCPTCTRIVTDAITELPRDYVELTAALELGTVGLAELVAATKDLPAPLRVSVAALNMELVRVASTWAEPVAEKLRVDWDSQLMDRRARPGYVLQRACRLLSKNMSVLLALRDVDIQVWAENGLYSQLEPNDGITGAIDLLNLHHIARAVLGKTKLIHELPAPCPNCGNVTLARDSGDDHVHCQRCRLQWPENDYRRLTLVIAAEYDEPARPNYPNRPRSGVEGTVARPVPVA